MIDILSMLSGKDPVSDFIQAGQQVISSTVAFVIELGMVGGIFALLIGAILYFTTVNSHAGRSLLINAVVLEILLACTYMAIFAVSGPPDLSIFFRLPG
nr:hypothetical protein [Candidatus Sigynarchaeota archaeon]